MGHRFVVGHQLMVGAGCLHFQGPSVGGSTFAKLHFTTGVATTVARARHWCEFALLEV
jgi:hypothetical protein